MLEYKNILVTGGFGFIGSHFVDLMVKNGKNVVIFDKLTYATKYNYVSRYGVPIDGDNNIFLGNKNVRLELVDIAMRDRLFEFLDIERNIDVVVNFAAESHVDRSLNNSDDFVDSNVLGVVNFLNYMINKPKRIKRFVQVSTDEVGGEWPVGSFQETDMIRPKNPYSATKACAEIFCNAYHSNFNLPVIITRGSNTYGPRQYPEKLIPLFVLNLLKNEKVNIYDGGTQIRDWLNVYDHANGIKFALENGNIGETYHIGGECELKNIDVIDIIFKKLGKQDSLKNWNASRVGHDSRYSLDCSKLKLLGWKKEKDFFVEIEKTIDWYVENFEMFV